MFYCLIPPIPAATKEDLPKPLNLLLCSKDRKVETGEHVGVYVCEEWRENEKGRVWFFDQGVIGEVVKDMVKCLGFLSFLLSPSSRAWGCERSQK